MTPSNLSAADLSIGELDVMRHALGLDRSSTATRNFFAADVEHIAVWEGLVDKGLAFEVANRLSPDRCFQVSSAGKSLLGVIL